MPSINTAELFDQAEFSDITISFSGKQVHCHKLVLCRASAYFNRLCGPGAQFAEGASAVIEFKDDDPEALECMLYYIYTGRYVNDNDSRVYDWRCKLQLAVVASKYLLPSLEVDAYHNVRIAVDSTEDAGGILHIVIGLRKFEGCRESNLALIRRLCTEHLGALYKLPAFRWMLESDQDLMWHCFDHAVRESNFAMIVEDLERDERGW